MGINTKGSVRKNTQTKETDPREKLEKDLRKCMHCKFFYGNNSGCLKNKTCSGGMSEQEKAALEEKKKSKCYGCPYGRGRDYCFPCMRELLGK